MTTQYDSLGTVLVEDRGSTPFLMVHGEALVAAAAWALGESGVTLLDVGTPWESLVSSGEPVVLHDSLCPMAPPEFLARCVDQAVEGDTVVVGVRPVTDTIKEVTDDEVVGTLDRDTLLVVCTPVVLPSAVVADLESLPTRDLTDLTAYLRERYPLQTIEAPPEASRVAGPDDVALLEEMTRTDQP